MVHQRRYRVRFTAYALCLYAMCWKTAPLSLYRAPCCIVPMAQPLEAGAVLTLPHMRVSIGVLTTLRVHCVARPVKWDTARAHTIIQGVRFAR